MRVFVLVTASSLIAASIVGCSTSAKLNRIQPTSTYPNKAKLSALLYVPEDMRARQVSTKPTTTDCGAWTANMDAGDAYLSAIQGGLAAAFDKVELAQSSPTPEAARDRAADIIVIASLQNENVSISVNTGMFSSAINSQFQTSVSLRFLDRDGALLYSYVANGSGFGNASGSCNDIAAALSGSMETGLRQVSDYIAQSAYGAVQIRDYEKTRSH